MIKEGQQADGRYCRYFTLGATEVDLHNRMRLSSLLGFFQETAGDQCELFGSGWSALWEKHGMCYVVVRVEIRMDRYPGTGETIRIDTWPDGRLRLIFDRSGEIYDAEGIRIGAIVSQWALLDVKERHFLRPDPQIIALPDTSTLSAPFELTKDHIFDDSDPSLRYVYASRAPRFSDFDYNGHMNNARYAEWAADAFWQALTDEERAMKPELRRLDVRFRAEIPAASEGRPLDVRLRLLPGEKLFSLKGITPADGEKAKRDVVNFECEGEYSF